MAQAPEEEVEEGFLIVINALEGSESDTDDSADASHNEEPAAHLTEEDEDDEFYTLINTVTGKALELYKLNNELIKRQLNAERGTGFLVDVSQIEERTRMFSQVASHAKAIIDNKDTLINFLQKQPTKDDLPIHASHHRDVVNTFELFAHCISSLDAKVKELDCMQQTLSMPVDHSAWDPKAMEIVSQMRELFFSANQLNQGIAILHKLRTGAGQEHEFLTSTRME